MGGDQAITLGTNNLWYYQKTHSKNVVICEKDYQRTLNANRIKLDSVAQSMNLISNKLRNLELRECEQVVQPLKEIETKCVNELNEEKLINKELIRKNEQLNEQVDNLNELNRKLVNHVRELEEENDVIKMKERMMRQYIEADRRP